MRGSQTQGLSSKLQMAFILGFNEMSGFYQSSFLEASMSRRHAKYLFENRAFEASQTPSCEPGNLSNRYIVMKITGDMNFSRSIL